MRVFSNLAISLDGKIADLRAPERHLGTPRDRQTMQVIRKQCDAIIVGAQTLRVHPHTYRLQGAKKQPVNVILTRSGQLPAAPKFWSDDSVIRFVFTTKKGLKAARLVAKERAFVEVVGEEELDLSRVLERLRESNLKNILVEGGGEVMAAFLEAKLLQEMFVTLTPWCLGGRQNPTLVGGAGLSDWSGLTLKRAKRVKDEIYLHYQVKGSARWPKPKRKK